MTFRESAKVWLAGMEILPGTHGKPVRPERFYRRFQALAQRAGLPKIRLHDMRHTWASIALGAGVSMKASQGQLGHSSMYFTADVYTHVQESVAVEAGRAVADTVAKYRKSSLADREHKATATARGDTSQAETPWSDVVGLNYFG